MGKRFIAYLTIVLAASFLISSLLTDDAFASIYFDKGVYTWTDKVNVRITEHGMDSENTSVRIHTSNHELGNYKLSKAGNGLYTGEITLTGFLHDVDGDGNHDGNPRTSGSGPNNGFLESARDDEFTISIRFGDGDKISKSAKIRWNVGDISSERLLSASRESVHIKVTDMDMNLNPKSLDKISIHAYSDSDKAGIVIDAIETQMDSGIFETIFSFSPEYISNGHNLLALHEDKVYVQYDDHTLPKPYGINDDLEIIAEFPPIPFGHLEDKKMQWSQHNYAVKNGTGTAKVIVTDSDMNAFSDSVDTLQVFVFSDSFQEGITLDLYETQKDTGIFERTFAFSDKRSAPSVLYAIEGNTVSARYDPTSSLDFASQNISISATMFLGLTGPPLERAPVLLAKITDVSGNIIDEPAVGEQVQIKSDIANGMNRAQKFAYIVMIQDIDGVTEHLAWIDGTLNPETAFSPSASWIPQKGGVHTATMFVWESIENPSALSPPITIEFTVISEDMKESRDIRQGDYDEQFLFIVPQKEFKASGKDLTKLHFYSIKDEHEISQLPRLNLLMSMTKDFPNEPIDRLGLRITDGQLDKYASFFTQKCIEQRPYANVETCSAAELAFEFDEEWYFLYPSLASHKHAIEDDTIDGYPEYFIQK